MNAPTCERCASATRSVWTPRGPDAVAQAPRARPAHRAREPRRTARRGHVRRVRAAAVRRPGAATPARGADRPHSGRRAGRGSRRGGRPAHAWRCPTTTPCWPARRGCATTSRRTACSTSPSAAGCRWCCSPRAAAGGPGTSTCRSSPAWTAAPFSCSRTLSGLVPLVGIASGYCFAGNAALLGCCDVVIATEDSSIGMGGPAMIEGGGLGVHEPGEVGPDRRPARKRRGRPARAPTTREAVALARRYLSYFHGPDRSRRRARPAAAARARPGATASASTTCGAVARRRCSTRARCSSCADGFGAGMITALARVDGRPLGVLAQRPDASRRRDRRRRRRQGGALPAAVRRIRPARAVPLRHPRLHGRPGGRAHSDRAPLRAPVPQRRQPDVPIGHDRAAQGLRAGRPGDGRRRLQGAAVHRRLADLGVRRAWASRAPCAWACGASSRRSPIPQERERVFEADGRRRLRARRRA